MTKKDYIKLAAAIAINKPNTTPEAAFQWAQQMHSIADVLQADNLRFNRERFIAACKP